jgi:hypothetical protein
MARPALEFRERTDYLSPALSLASGRIGYERQVGQVRPPIRKILQSTLTNYGFLQTTLIRIAEDCDKGNCYISMAATAVNFEK